ncbi:nuclear transport factor 2-like isoform X1 [Nicotiana sylvestris]|uniref:G3BP-like protein isoform X1 n=1 Tax=Nicotiana sylvestris TaxID=4096 RepID=A0A1U7VNF7_NICSY|nr:PREDICTED: putative G3BP-like protein isoform X1 [Nicotiana sylvestris]
MATPFHLPVTAAQVGTYFVGQYYQMLQTQPDFVHQFYSDASTVLRIDSSTRETASGMLQIHTLVMSLHYTGMEIKTLHSLESWNGGVLVMVSGSVHVKGINRSRKFVQTFFLAPQEKGYFVLNDIFHYVDEEQILQHPVPYLGQISLDSKLNVSTAIQEQVPNYMLGGEIQAREFAAAPKIQDNGPVNNYSFPEERLQHVPEAEKILEDNFAAQSNGSLQSTINAVQEHLSSPIEEPVAEPQKHTYASILQVTKGQSAQGGPAQSSFNKPTPPPSEWQHVSEPLSLSSVPSTNAIERSITEATEEASAVEDEAEVKSVYVKNVPTTMAAYEIEEEFKKFGKLKPDAVAIRTRKDIDVCYAFVEFEDVTGVQNAIEASTVQIGGHQLYIEGRRPNRNNLIRGRGRGRGRVSYSMDGRGRYGSRGFGRGGQDGGDRDYGRSRGNGYYRQAPRQERAYSGNQQSLRNEQYSWE